MKPNLRSAITKINKHGALLVFPINNKKEPHSLWSEFYPRSKMKWEWDADGDDRVGHMWQLMKRLSDCREVVYSKWYQGRATFFSRELFTAMLCILQKSEQPDSHLSQTSRLLLDTLESNSPMSTKELKAETDLRGKFLESTYNRGLKPLFQSLQVVAFGEVEDGAFPSLAVGATRLLYEDLWNEAAEMDLSAAQKTLDLLLPKESLIRKAFDKILNQPPKT